MMSFLGIGSVEVSNQVIQRDRYAEYFCFLANVATTLDKIGVEIRSMQRTEIGEVEEAFGSKQVGSSTMPHKRNPIRSEQICGLARIVRSAVEPAFQNNTLWDERDLTNSSPERILFPEATILCDHIISLMTTVITGLLLRPDRIRSNLILLQGINMAESVMIELTKRGMPRQEAHEVIRVRSMEALETRRPLADLLSTTPDIIRYLSSTEIARLLDPEQYLGTSVSQVERLESRLRPLAK